MLTLGKGEVPDDEYAVPPGWLGIKGAGTDVTMVAIGWMVERSGGR